MHVQFNNVRSHTFLQQNITYFYTEGVGALNLYQMWHISASSGHSAQLALLTKA